MEQGRHADLFQLHRGFGYTAVHLLLLGAPAGGSHHAGSINGLGDGHEGCVFWGLQRPSCRSCCPSTVRGAKQTAALLLAMEALAVLLLRQLPIFTVAVACRRTVFCDMIWQHHPVSQGSAVSLQAKPADQCRCIRSCKVLKSQTLPDSPCDILQVTNSTSRPGQSSLGELHHTVSLLVAQHLVATRSSRMHRSLHASRNSMEAVSALRCVAVSCTQGR